MRNTTLVVAVFLLPILTISAQDPAGTAGTAGIEGRITDAESNEPLVGATVVELNSRKGAVTDSRGRFLVSGLPEGAAVLAISYLGYDEKRLEGLVLKRGENLDLGDIQMQEGGISLKEITVSPGSFTVIGGAPSSRLALSEQDIKNMSWAEDITRAVARLPGISSSDYSSKFAIRGGEADEVLIALDGMELYEPFHQRDYSGGLFSIVDIETIEGVELMTGGFSADYGNRLSGVFNMSTKKVSGDKRHTSVGLSLMNARLYTDGRFADGKGSYLFSARRGMLDLAFKAIGNDEVFPKFYDVMAKAEYALNGKQLLSLHALHAGDRTDINNSPEGDSYDQFQTKYGNNYTWLTLKSGFTPRLYARSILYVANINHNRSGGYIKYENSDKGSVSLSDKRDYTLFGAKQDWVWEASDKFHLRAGFEAKQLYARYDYSNAIHELRVNAAEEIVDFDRELDIHMKPSGQQAGVYLDGRYKILPRLIAETGLRYDHTTYTGDRNWSPRASLAYAFSKTTFLRAGWGYYYQSQFINTIDVNNGNVLFNPAELAVHYVVGFEHLFKNGISLRAEAYYKDLSNISPLWQNLRDHLEVYPEARNDNARVVFNGITSKGIEIFLKHDNGGKISWWFSYALAKAEDDVKDIEFEGLLVKRTGKVPRLNDQRHTIFADINYRPNARWHFNLSWHYYRGWPRTDYTYRYQALPNGDLHFYPVHGEFNGIAYPAYHRMDVRGNRSFHTRHGVITAFLHIVNVYNRQNLKKFDLDTRNDAGELSVDADGNYVPFEDNKYWLGLTPVFGLSWAF